MLKHDGLSSTLIYFLSQMGLDALDRKELNSFHWLLFPG